MNPFDLAARMADHSENTDLDEALRIDCANAARFITRTLLGPPKDVALEPLSPAAADALRELGILD